MFTSFNFEAMVPGRGLKINENEFINLIFFTKFKVSSKSLFSSPGYPIIKSLEIFIKGLFFIHQS